MVGFMPCGFRMGCVERQSNCHFVARYGIPREDGRVRVMSIQWLSSVWDAVPFQSGQRWGLKSGGRVIVPPVYRSIRKPVVDYCAVEANPRQWGVIMLDGRMVIEARYANVEINENGTARLIIIPGKTKTVNLKRF